MKTIKICLFLCLLSCLIGCGRLNLNNSLSDNHLGSSVTLNTSNSNLTEVAPPKIIQELNHNLEQYVPQVKIIVPQPEQILNQTDVNVRLEVEDLPIFQDDKLQLGNHLNLIVDNEPFQAIYNLNQPIILKGLTPGTHTIRVFAARPWGESFKNDGAYAQTTFNVLTKTNDNRPNQNLPLLTYSSPTGVFGAEPLLLDFYLTNAPLHAIAHENSNLQDWRIKATVSGTSFILENWQPIYLAGLEPGENWVKLELIDESGNDIENAFNNTVRVFTYDPQQTDTLAKLVTNKISLAEAQPIIEPVEKPEISEPTVKTEDEETETKVEKTTKEIGPVPSLNTSEAEPTIKEQKQEALKNSSQGEPATSQNNDFKAILENDNKEVITKITKEPIAISAPVTKKIEKVAENSENIALEAKDAEKPTEQTPVTESTSKQVITVREGNSNSPTPTAEIEIPQPESIAIAEDEIAITVPSKKTTTVPESKTKTPVWWKKLLVGLRQKLEGLVKLLPNEV